MLSAHNPRCSHQGSQLELPQLRRSRADLGLKAAGKLIGTEVRNGRRWQPSLPFVAAARRLATCAPTETAA